MRASQVFRWALITAVIFFAVSPFSYADSFSDISLKFRQEVTVSPQNPEVYERYVAELEQAHILDGDSASFMKMIQGVLDVKADREIWHRLAISLYGKGHDEASGLMMDEYEKNSISISEAVSRTRRVLDRAKGGLSEKTAGAADRQMEALEKAAAAVPHDRLRLKNGQVLDGTVTAREEGGVWFETGPGAGVFFSEAEIASVESPDRPLPEQMPTEER